MSPWSSELRLTPRGTRFVAGIGLLLLAFACGPAPRPALVTAAACIAVLIADLASTVRRSRSTRLRVQVSGRTFAGEPRPLEILDAGDTGDLPRVFPETSDGPTCGWTPADPQGATNLLVPIRGLHRIARWIAEREGPLGLTRARARVSGPSTLVVAPQPLSDTEARALGLVPIEGIAGRQRQGPPHEPCPAGLRAWRSGDPMRMVHSRASARRGRPVVREDEPPSASGLAIELDRRIAPAELDYALAALTRLLLDAERRGLPLRIQSQDLDLSIGPGLPHGSEQALRFVASAQPTTTPLRSRSHTESVELTHVARLGGRA